MLLTACNLQDKALMGRVLADLKEVVSIVREASAQQFDRMCTLEKKWTSALGVPLRTADARTTSSQNSM